MTPEEIATLAEAEMVKAKSLTSDAGSISRRDASEITALAHLAGSQRAAANSNGFFGCRIRKAVPGSPAE